MNELQPLSQIFQKRLFRIPDYQRGYAWQDQQLRDFWEDIINLQPDRYHYTGLLSLKVLNKAESQNLGNNDKWLMQSGYKAYHIVDGQQRMTTFIIMLNEIVELVCRLPENEGRSEDEILLGYETIKDIRAQYISKKRPPDGLIITYMFGYENDNPSAEYMKHRILGQPFGGTIKETYYTKNLQYAKDFFARELLAFYEIKGIEGVAELYRKLTQHLMFNIHEIEDDYDVFVAFETMNNRGKKLTNLELLKNRLIYLTTLYPKSILDESNEAALRELINKAWREVYYQLGRNENDLLSDNEFLRAHWIMYYSYSRKRGDDYIKFLLRKFSHKSIFENVLQPPAEESLDYDSSELDPDEYEDIEPIVEFPEPISGEFLQPKEIMDYVNSLNETAEYWYYTFYPDKCTLLSDEEKVWIDKINRVGIGYFRPMIAVSMIPRLGFTKEERLAFYKAVERFIFITFRMAMYQSSYKSSDYNRKTRELYFGNLSLADITEDLKATTDSDARDAIRVFVTRMNRRFVSSDGFYSWRDLRYFLYEYEYSLATKYKLEKLSWALLTRVVKDKITVEHILPQTPTKLYWRNAFRQFTPAEIKTLSASLGNMLPLSQSINSSLQNDSFDDKKARGYVNGCHCEIEISKEPAWDAEHIYDRGMKLLHFMESRWDIQFESKEQMEELLHVSFVHDGRDIPPVIVEEKAKPESVQSEASGTDRSSHVVALIMDWLSDKDNTGELHLCRDKCEKKYIRFTTDQMTAIMPDAQNAKSGWRTKNHYFYEVHNYSGKKINMQFALSGENIPDDLSLICDRINEFFPVKQNRKGWKWRLPFCTARAEIADDMSDDEIIAIIIHQYDELKQFESKLVASMGGEPCSEKPKSAIDVTFDFRTDSRGKDPDTYSTTLKSYHQKLWSKELPNGEIMELKVGGVPYIFTWKNFALTSDTIIVEINNVRNKKIIDQVYELTDDPKAYYEHLIRRSYTIGGMILFPCHTNSMNQLRGMNPKISDRWDLTLECIRRHYAGETSPLTKVIESDREFFDLFVDFKGYVDFFLLQDCVSEDYSSVDIWCGDASFEKSGLPETVEDYFEFIRKEHDFLDKRNKRIQEYCLEHNL